MKTITDQIGNTFTIDKSPERIICLVPSITELLVDLGLKDKIVGVTKFCVHPKELREHKTIIGGTKNIKLEKIEALNPDIILCNKEENTKEIVTNCSKICNVYVSNIYTIKDTIAIIKTYGKLFNCDEKAQEIIEKLTLEIKDFKDFIKNKTVLKVAYFIWKNPWMVAANKTFINHLLEINNFENTFKNIERYPEIKILELEKRNLDLVLLSSEPYPFKEKDLLELKNRTINCSVQLVDGALFSWYGTRLLRAFKYFKNLRLNYESSLSK